jgi:hypothetical protein
MGSACLADAEGRCRCKMGVVAKLDTEWAISEIDQFLQVTAQVVPNMGDGIAFLGTVMRGSETDASARAHVVEQIRLLARSCGFAVVGACRR